METLELLIAGIISLLPSITAVVGSVITFVKNSKKIDSLAQEVRSKKEFQTLKQQLEVVHQENIELKKQLNVLIATMNHMEPPKGE